MRPRATLLAVALAAACSTTAHAGQFDEAGRLVAESNTALLWSFAEAPPRTVPTYVAKRCAKAPFSLHEADDALEGSSYLTLSTATQCEERWRVRPPEGEGAYAARIWLRHGVLQARLSVDYSAESGLRSASARLFPTGRATSDGWVELASNTLSIHADPARAVHLVVSNFGALSTTDVDAFELVAEGDHVSDKACEGAHDPVCGEGGICMYGLCANGSLGVPTLPVGSQKDAIIDAFSSRLRLFFGGRATRQTHLPEALAVLDEARTATSAWGFWNRIGLSIRTLHDSHTAAWAPIVTPSYARRLNVCFIEGDADLSQGAWPKDARYQDLLVSHVGTADTLGLHPGDRLLAIDGLHPFDWVKTLIDVDWGFSSATDDHVYAEYAEDLGGPWWAGGALIARFAKTVTVLRCDGAAGTCAKVPETIATSSLTNVGGDYDMACDNRPSYHLAMEGPPDPTNHYVYWSMFRGAIANTQPEEAIFGMVWDTLYGGGDPNGWVNGNISAANDDWKKNARGVILDHRAGNGGTLDAAENVTKLVRPPETVAVVRMPIQIGGDDGPETLEEGQKIFTKWSKSLGYDAGDAGYDPALPVALLIHRDVSASDYMPFAMKGAPNVRIFGPHATAGAFSTFINFEFYNGMGFQIASGDTIAASGEALIGTGVAPDVVVQQRQSDLMVGVDSIHEAALSWVRENLK